MIQLFQLGDVPIHGYTEPNPTNDWESNSKPETAINSPLVFRGQDRFNPKPRSIRVELTLYNDEFRSREDILQQLTNLANHDIPIIAYDTTSAHAEFRRQRDSRVDIRTEEVLWLETRGQITKVSPSNRGKETNVRLDIDIDPYWMPLNNILWQKVETTTEADHWMNQTTLSSPFTPNPYPNGRELRTAMLSRPFVFHKTIMTNWGDQFTPEFFEALHTTTPNIPDLGFHTDWSTDTTSVISAYVDRQLWAIPPIIKYVFRSLPATGTITIAIERETELYNTQTYTTTIDLAEVDTAITTAGYTRTSTDKLIVGDVHWRPGYVLRDQTLISQVSDAITRDADGWVGQLLTGTNRITITVPSGVEWFIGTINRKA